MSVLDPELISAEESETPLLHKLESMLANNNFSSSTVNTALPKLVNPDGETSDIPVSVLQALQQMIDYMIHEKALRMVAYDQAMTVREAADFLNTRKLVVENLLDTGQLPYFMVGTCRLIPLEDLVKYKKRISQERRQALAEMTQLSQEAGNY